MEIRLYQYITGICKDFESPIIQIGGTSDHLHILLILSRKIAIYDLIGKIKANSSKWIKKIGPNYSKFAWQNGYGCFSIGESGKNQAIAYIQNQKKHHSKLSFQDEYRILLKKYKISFTEEHLWD